MGGARGTTPRALNTRGVVLREGPVGPPGQAAARSVAVFEAPAFVAGFDDVAMVGEAVEHGGGHFGVEEDLRPIGEGVPGMGTGLEVKVLRGASW
jgi:hypothetical protein